MQPDATRNSTGPVIVHVSYRGDATTRFDCEYYVSEHLPLVRRSWRPHGLLSAEAFFPAVAQAGTIAICECRFRDAAAVEAAFAAPQTPAVMADVLRFTDVVPIRTRAEHL